MYKTRNAKVLLAVFLFCVCSIFFTPTSAAQQHVPPVRAAAEQDDMINISDATDLVDTTLNGLEEIHSILRHLMSMASRSARGSYSDTQRALMNAYFQDYMNEIDLVVESTEYNGFKMLDGLIESIAVRQMRKSFRINGVDMTQIGLGLDGNDLDISTPQSARQTMEFLGEAIAIEEQVRCTYVGYFIRLNHLPEPNRRIYRQDDDLLGFDDGMYLIGHTLAILGNIYSYVTDLRVTVAHSTGSLLSPAQRTIMDAMFQETLNEIDSLAEMSLGFLGDFKMLSSSTGSVTVRLNEHPQLGGLRGKPLVIEKVDVTLAGLGLDREDLNIRTIQSAEQATEDIEGAIDLLLSIHLTYHGYFDYLETLE